MIVYVESNFVLEIALGQEENAEARRILNLAHEALVEIAVPSFALCEPFGTITQRGRDGIKLSRMLGDHLRQLLYHIAANSNRLKASLKRWRGFTAMKCNCWNQQ